MFSICPRRWSVVCVEKLANSTIASAQPKRHFDNLASGLGSQKSRISSERLTQNLKEAAAFEEKVNVRRDNEVRPMHLSRLSTKN